MPRRSDHPHSLDRLEREIGTAIDTMLATKHESSLLPEPCTEVGHAPVVARRTVLGRADGKQLRLLLDEYGFDPGEHAR